MEDDTEAEGKISTDQAARGEWHHHVTVRGSGAVGAVFAVQKIVVCQARRRPRQQLFEPEVVTALGPTFRFCSVCICVTRSVVQVVTPGILA